MFLIRDHFFQVISIFGPIKTKTLHYQPNCFPESWKNCLRLLLHLEHSLEPPDRASVNTVHEIVIALIANSRLSHYFDLRQSQFKFVLLHSLYLELKQESRELQGVAMNRFVAMRSKQDTEKISTRNLNSVTKRGKKSLESFSCSRKSRTSEKLEKLELFSEETKEEWKNLKEGKTYSPKVVIFGYFQNYFKKDAFVTFLKFWNFLWNSGFLSINKFLSLQWWLLYSGKINANKVFRI